MPVQNTRILDAMVVIINSRALQVCMVIVFFAFIVYEHLLLPCKGLHMETLMFGISTKKRKFVFL